jgi:hypothetical protein
MNGWFGRSCPSSFSRRCGLFPSTTWLQPHNHSPPLQTRCRILNRMGSRKPGGEVNLLSGRRRSWRAWPRAAGTRRSWMTSRSAGRSSRNCSTVPMRSLGLRAGSRPSRSGWRWVLRLPCKSRLPASPAPLGSGLHAAPRASVRLARTVPSCPCAFLVGTPRARVPRHTTFVRVARGRNSYLSRGQWPVATVVEVRNASGMGVEDKRGTSGSGLGNGILPPDPGETPGMDSGGATREIHASMRETHA